MRIDDDKGKSSYVSIWDEMRGEKRNQAEEPKKGGVSTDRRASAGSVFQMSVPVGDDNLLYLAGGGKGEVRTQRGR